MKIVVTGVSGYIGTRLCRHFQEDARVDEVVGIDVRAPSDVAPKLRVVERDVTAPLADLFAGADVAVHLAWVLNPIKDAAAMTTVNLGGTRRVLEACGRAGVKRLLLASSATAYGAHADNPVPLLESHPIDVEQQYQYAREKAIMEGMARTWRDFHAEARVTIVRPSIVFGPHVKNFISASMMQPLVPLVAGCDPPVQFTHEDDVARALYELVARDAEGTFNVGAPGMISTRQMASALHARILNVSERTAKAIGEVGWRLGLKQISQAPPDILDFLRYPWVVDGGKLAREVGFEYRYDTAAVLKSFVESHERIKARA